MVQQIVSFTFDAHRGQDEAVEDIKGRGKGKSTPLLRRLIS